MPIIFSDEQMNLVGNLTSALIGIFGAMGVQWISKKRSKDEVENSNVDAISKAATENVKASQLVIEMLQSMLEEKSKGFSEMVETSKKDCQKQLELHKEETSTLIADFEAKMILMNMEKEKMTKEIIQLTHDKISLSIRVDELTKQLEQYRIEYNGKNNTN